MEKHFPNIPNLEEMMKKAKEQQANKAQQTAAKPFPYGGFNLPNFMMGKADNIVIKSSTPGSEKRFKITVDDSGTISAAEITENA